ncbi:insulinase family protein, partial [Neptuniibacter sp.]|uniref:insulinase family protein n=1 Tax=Neptuniibacter sp. TaxID=1962643 RepID=UPI00261BFCB8
FRRGYAATKHVMNQENSYNRFAVGSLKTLADRENSKVRDELIKFYEQYYSANLMSLVVLGKESLPELKQMVQEKFSAVKNSNAKPFHAEAPLFRKDRLPQQVVIEPVKDIRSLSLTFPIPGFRSQWQKKPLYYISNLVGYEGKGSLLSLLKEKGWATSLSASPGHNLNNQGSFMVNIRLTEEGMDNYLAVTQNVFQYIELMKKQGLNEDLFTEEKQLSAIQFRFQEQSEPIHLVSALASQMQHLPTEQVISSNYTFTEFDKGLINSYLAEIKPENLFLNIKAKNLGTDQVEPYYKAPFSVRGFTEQELSGLQVKQIDPKLTIRAPNPYIAKDLNILSSDDGKKPTLINSKDGFSLWYQQDTEFNVPRGNFYFTVQSPLANQDAKHWVLNSLFTEMVQEQLNETLYDAYLAGMGTNIYSHMKGYSVRLSGYNDKLHVLLQQVVDALKAPEFDKKRFAILKQRFTEKLKNGFNDKPYNQTTGRMYELLMSQADKRSQLDAIENITLDDLQQFSIQLLKAPAIKALAHGNLTEEYTRNMGDLVSKALLTDKTTATPAITVTQLPLDTPLTETLDIEHNDAAISVLLQGENNSAKARAELSVLSEILASPFYNQMRTEKQLGYIVFATPLQMNKTPGLGFIIQSPNTDAVTLEQNINQFLQEWQSNLDEFDVDSLNRFKASVLSRITKKDNKLSSRTKRYWRELDWGELSFDTREQLAEAVQKVSIQDLQLNYKQLQQRRLTVRSFGTKLSSNNTLKITNAKSYLKGNKPIVPDV